MRTDTIQSTNQPGTLARHRGIMSTENNDGAQPTTPEQAQMAELELSGVSWKNPEGALSKLRESHDIAFDPATGQVNVTARDGETVPLSTALRNLAGSPDGAQYVDGRSVKFLSKADFPDVRSKTSFIAANGLAAYEALPLTRPHIPSGEPKTQEQYRQLSRQDKMKLMRDKGPAWLESLPTR